jgi:hypothetical protein
LNGFPGFGRIATPARRLARFRARAVSVAFAGCALLAAFALAGCGGVNVRPQDQVPTPLVDELPLRAGIYYSPEFRAYVHREERWGTKWEAQLGAAHVTKLNRLLLAMMPGLVEVQDLSSPPQPPLQLILEPRFEEYSFITPRDAGAEYYAVTIKYRMNLYDGQARLIDSLVYTGYGNEEGGGLTTEAPLVAATQKAMRDAGAKFATEFPDQATVKKLLAGETVPPVQGGGAPAAAIGGIEEVTPSAAAGSGTVPAGSTAPGSGPVPPASSTAPPATAAPPPAPGPTAAEGASTTPPPTEAPAPPAGNPAPSAATEPTPPGRSG